ncbi:MAG: hypothetical protein ACPGRW_06415 [Flavobacteriaceae bacterium]
MHKIKYSQKTIDLIASSIIVLETANYLLGELKHTRFAKRILKKHISNTLEEIKRKESSEIDILFENEDEATTILLDADLKFTETVSRVNIKDKSEVTGIIQAYNVNPKRLVNLANKILKEQDNEK